MSTLTLTRQYEIKMAGAPIVMGFTDQNELYTKMMMIKKTAPLSDISSITVKKSALSAKIEYHIKEWKNNKERLFQVLQMDSADPEGLRFISDLKARVPNTCTWNDKLTGAVEKAVASENGKHTYPMQVMWFLKGKTLAGMGWGFQMAMNYGGLTVCTLGLALPLTLYAFITGCHKVTTSDDGINVKKLGNKFFNWGDIAFIEPNRYNITVTKYGAEVDKAFLIRFNLKSTSGKKCEFIIRSLEGKLFIQEMIERKKMTDTALTMFI